MKFLGVLLWSVGVSCALVAFCGLVLFGVGVRFGVVGSSSMVPTLQVGEVICWAKTSAFGQGDIVLFDDGDKRVAHRVIRYDGDFLVVCGDSPSNTPAVISATQVRGKLVFSVSVSQIICICVAIAFLILVCGKFVSRKCGVHALFTK